jgi:imidazoleglycerol phosphate dehydratase HisB
LGRGTERNLPLVFGTNKHHRFDGNFSKISVVMTDAVEPLSTKKFTEKL